MSSLLKDKTEKTFPKTPSPHLFAAHSSPRIIWGFFAALIPLWAGGIAAHGTSAVWIFILAVGISCGVHFLCGKRSWLQIGNAAFMGGLFALLLPAQISWQGVVLGALTCSFIGQVIFGGIGQNLFHPAIVGYAVLFLFAPDLFLQKEDSLTGWSEWFLIRQSASLGTASFFALVFSAAFLLFKRWIVWHLPFFYFLVLGILSVFLGRSHLMEWFHNSVFFAAFFFLADPVTTPMTQRGRAIFAVAAALLTVFLGFRAEPLPAALCAIFFLNGFVPLLDRWMRPMLRMIP